MRLSKSACCTMLSHVASRLTFLCCKTCLEVAAQLKALVPPAKLSTALLEVCRVRLECRMRSGQITLEELILATWDMQGSLIDSRYACKVLPAARKRPAQKRVCCLVLCNRLEATCLLIWQIKLLETLRLLK